MLFDLKHGFPYPPLTISFTPSFDRASSPPGSGTLAPGLS
jgi:hypothetical protein